MKKVFSFLVAIAIILTTILPQQIFATEVAPQITIHIEKPDNWSEVWIWYDSDLSTPAWNTTTLKTPPGDMVNYRSGWFKKEISVSSGVKFLFNDGTWNKKLDASGFNSSASGNDFFTDKNIWIKKDGSISYTDPVAPVTVKSIEIINASSSVEVGSSLALTAKVTYSDNQVKTEAVNWTSSDTTVASISPASAATANVTGLKEGSVVITAEKDGVQAQKTITVNKAGEGVTIYVEKPDNWGEIWIWYDSNLSTPAWDTTALKSPPGDMVNYRTGWYKKVITNTTQVQFLFNDGTWNNKITDGGKDFNTTTSIWIKKDGTKHYQDPVVPAPPKVSATPGTSNFNNTTTITLAVSGDNITAARYTLDGSDPAVSGINYTNGTKVTIGSDMAVNTTKTLKLFATNGTITDTQQYTYTKTDVVTGNADVKNLRIYQVMVSSFQDGDPNVGYGIGYGPSHHRGDLKGIKNALPYIKSLGMNAIWLTPIFDSNGSSKLDSTGYFAQNYFRVDPKFGTMQDAKDLVNAAHELGMYVFLDGVFGHHKAGVTVPASPSGFTKTGRNNPVSYPGSLNFYKEVATWWIDQLEIDGWRLDQAYQVSTMNQDRNYWKDIREAVEAKCAERKNAGKQWGTLGYMVGEIWDSAENIQKWGYNAEGQAGLLSNFDFPGRYALVQVLATQEHTQQAGAYNQPASNLNKVFDSHKIYSSFAIPNFMITNHDLVRLGDLIQRAPHLGYGKENPDYWKRHKAAFSFMTAYSGPITVYYGDEIGDEVVGFVREGDMGMYDDHVSRSNGQITGFNTQQLDLKNYVTSLMNLRENNPALWKGSRVNLVANTTQYADLKQDGNDKIVYVLNTGTSATTIVIPMNKVGGTKLVDALTNEVITGSNGNYNIPVQGLSGRFLKVQN